MPGYQQPCRYCNQLVPPDSNACPSCGKINPLGPTRCPKCRSPIQEGWKKCSSCGLTLEVACPKCQKVTWFGDYCQYCEAQLFVVCPNKKCQTAQPPLGDKCVKCGKPLKRT
jgi:RNA polymerase subunit RPABC4/transcription elongation factor Spt4